MLWNETTLQLTWRAVLKHEWENTCCCLKEGSHLNPKHEKLLSARVERALVEHIIMSTHYILIHEHL